MASLRKLVLELNEYWEAIQIISFSFFILNLKCQRTLSAERMVCLGIAAWRAGNPQA